MKQIVLVLFSLITLSIFAKNEYKYGNVTKEELEEKKYKKDSLTGASFIYNIGETQTTINAVDFRLNTIFTKSTKIKIYDKNALHLANQTLVLYNDKFSSNAISLYNVKGKTYNLENGKIVEYNLPKSAVKIDKLDDYHSIVHIPFNNVHEGSVIEYEIVLSIPGATIPDWYFQERYPVEYSQFSINMAEFFKYRKSTKGYLQIPREEIDGRNEKIGDFEYAIDKSTWKMKNIPAYVDEPFVYCSYNYITQITHELLSVKFPYQIEQNITVSWNKILEILLNSDYLGKLINGNSAFLNNEYNNAKDIKDNVERMKQCYKLIQNSMSWNNVNTIYSESIKQAYKETKGSSADINILLLRLLKDCNIESYPVVLSTRENGFVPMFPTFNKFNYLIVLAKVNGQSYLLDATEKYLPPNILPTRCINEKGLIVKEGTTIDWVDLSPKQTSTILNSTEIKLNNEGKINGKSTYKRMGYAALDTRNQLIKNNTQNKQEWILKNAIDGIEISNYTVSNKDSIDLPIVENFDFILNNSTINNTSIIILEPIFFEKMTDNPFKNPERLYPVEFPTPIDKTYIVNISLPDNTTVEEKPKNIVINMPDNTAKFTYQINLIGNAIQLNAKLNIKNTLYTQDQYPYLKEFYAQVISKLNEPILLQRK